MSDEGGEASAASCRGYFRRARSGGTATSGPCLGLTGRSFYSEQRLTRRTSADENLPASAKRAGAPVVKFRPRIQSAHLALISGKAGWPGQVPNADARSAAQAADAQLQSPAQTADSEALLGANSLPVGRGQRSDRFRPPLAGASQPRAADTSRRCPEATGRSSTLNRVQRVPDTRHFWRVSAASWRCLPRSTPNQRRGRKDCRPKSRTG